MTSGGFGMANSGKLKEWIDPRRPHQLINYSLDPSRLALIG